MPADFEDRLSPESLSDDELRRLVRQALEAQDTVDADNILVRVSDGVVVLGGRVGTEEERRVAEHVVTDLVGASLKSELVVDPIRRDQEPEAIDDHLARSEGDEEPLGGALDEESDSAAHLREDLDARLFGTHDVQRAIANGTSWEPPDSPTPEGYQSSARDPEDVDDVGERR